MISLFSELEFEKYHNVNVLFYLNNTYSETKFLYHVLYT